MCWIFDVLDKCAGGAHFEMSSTSSPSGPTEMGGTPLIAERRPVFWTEQELQGPGGG
jgi:hypothetical protein